MYLKQKEKYWICGHAWTIKGRNLEQSAGAKTISQPYLFSPGIPRAVRSPGPRPKGRNLTVKWRVSWSTQQPSSQSGWSSSPWCRLTRKVKAAESSSWECTRTQKGFQTPAVTSGSQTATLTSSSLCIADLSLRPRLMPPLSSSSSSTIGVARSGHKQFLFLIAFCNHFVCLEGKNQ